MSSPRSLPQTAEVVERIQESATVFTLRLRFTEASHARAYQFAPGQFNMLGLHGIGEVPISIVSDPDHVFPLDHTIRAVGRVTQALAVLGPGDSLGVRGPFGCGWPLAQARGRDLLLITGGLGCAPVVSVINYVLRRRAEFGAITILQGVKHADDLIWRERYDAWRRIPGVQVLLASDIAAPGWTGQVGPVTALFGQLRGLAPARSLAMLCGPEPMMRAVTRELLARGLPEDAIHLSLERNMQCAVGHCGHCQIGPLFVCRDGPVFSYAAIKPWFGRPGL